eukprot:11179855-Lingulodinium_polyedra.AAC.1
MSERVPPVWQRATIDRRRRAATRPRVPVPYAVPVAFVWDARLPIEAAQHGQPILTPAFDVQASNATL